MQGGKVRLKKGGGGERENGRGENTEPPHKDRDTQAVLHRSGLAFFFIFFVFWLFFFIFSFLLAA